MSLCEREREVSETDRLRWLRRSVGAYETMNARFISKVWCCTAVVFLACSDEPAGSTFSMDESRFIPITEDLRLGSVGDPDVGFTRLHSEVHITEGDTIYVAELSVPEVRVYAPDGSFVRRIGRRGDGPGELQAIDHWGIQGDTLWVIQDDPPRITLFARDGSVFGTVSSAGFQITSGQVYGEVRPVALRPDGRFDGGLVSWGMPYPYAGPRETLVVPHVIFSSSGAVADTLGYGEKSLGGLPEVFETVGGVRVEQREAFPSWPLSVRVGWDSIQVLRPVAQRANSGLVTVVRLDAQRDTVFRRDLQYAPHVVDARVRDSVIDRRVASYSVQLQQLPGMRGAVEAMTEVPRFYPPIQSVVVTGDESLWLSRAFQTGGQRDWTWLSLDGVPRGNAKLPAGALIVGHHDGAIYTTETDEFGVPWLVRYRMGPA